MDWKNFSLFQMFHSDDKTEQMIGAWMYAKGLEEEKEQEEREWEEELLEEDEETWDDTDDDDFLF